MTIHRRSSGSWTTPDSIDSGLSPTVQSLLAADDAAGVRSVIGAGTDAHADDGDATTLTTATGRAIAFAIALG